jgi:hypothetical protein
MAGFHRVWWVGVASGLVTALLSLPLRRTVAGSTPSSPAAFGSEDEAAIEAAASAEPVPMPDTRVPVDVAPIDPRATVTD